MSRMLRSLRLCSVSLVVLVGITSAFLITRASIESSTTPVSAPAPADSGPRNIFRQPEALRMGQRLGKRLGPSSRAAAVVVGRVTTGNSDQFVTITRRQTKRGEDVELILEGRALRWNAQDGTQAVSSPATEAERVLLERLIFDSPDHFVLAQLHGASYFTVARNVRPPGVPDDYSGPLWTIVRIDEPQADGASHPTSPWRLYYINSATGLIDQIVSRLGDQTIEARISSWTEQSGEKVPAQITWSIDGRAVMSYQAISVSHNE